MGWICSVSLYPTGGGAVMDNSVGEGIEICVADNASSDGVVLKCFVSEFPVVPFD